MRGTPLPVSIGARFRSTEGGMMSHVRWTPLTELDSIERRMRRLFEEIGFAPVLLPAADVYETDKEYVVELEAPGYQEKDLAVEVSDQMLVVTGQREGAKEEPAKRFSLHERLERTFERRFMLPAEADSKQLRATYGDGVLTVHAPKIRAAQPTKVAITGV
jgi:HSP20 family protein